jgi:hypothetical protein
MKIWKLLSAVAVDGALFVLLPYVFSRYGMIVPLDGKAYTVLFVTWAGLTLKLFLGDVVSDKFEYHKHGYDFCTLTMGTALSMFSLQLVGGQDLLHKLPTTGVWSLFAFVSADTSNQHTFILAALFLAASVLAFVTARISRSVSDPATRWKALLAMFNFVLGSGSFGTYVFLLLVKA